MAFRLFWRIPSMKCTTAGTSIVLGLNGSNINTEKIKMSLLHKALRPRFIPTMKVVRIYLGYCASLRHFGFFRDFFQIKKSVALRLAACGPFLTQCTSRMMRDSFRKIFPDSTLELIC